MSYLSSKFSNQAGFTLAEMMTVVAIVMIMTSVVLANLPDFRDRSSLDLVAQEVGLVIRQAQAYGSQTRATLFADNPFPSYGIYFNLTDVNAPSQTATSFILFADKQTGPVTAPDRHYSDADTNSCGTVAKECREVFNLQGGITIEGISLCHGSNSCVPQPHLNITFDRPNPEAHFISNASGEISGYDYAKITLKGPKVNLPSRDICVWTTGHIYSKLTCP